MYGQLLELIIFAGIAFFVINKLISMLGTSNDEDPAKNKKSYFGEPSQIKDVTGTGSTKQSNVIRAAFFNKQKNSVIKDLVADDCLEDVTEGLTQVQRHVPLFDLAKFLTGARAAFKMIIDNATTNDKQDLKELVDKRYIDHFSSIAASYGNYEQNNDLSAKVSEIYMFGNNIFVKVLFIGKNITDKIKDLHEEWTFTKSALSTSPEWYLSNIDRPQ
jgi:predicted lipid-binding transport protein (Tim44 family)